MTKYTTEQLWSRMMQDADAKSPASDELRYGEPETLDTSTGRKIAVQYRGDSVSYFVPRESAWTAGARAIQIDKAYRIFEETGEQAMAREVRDFSELESVAAGYLMEIHKALAKAKR